MKVQRRSSDTEVSEFVCRMTSIPMNNGRRLSESERLGYHLAAKYVQQAGSEPIDVCTLHRLAFPNVASAGQIRRGSVLEMSALECESKLVLRSLTAANLMARFHSCYKQALSDDLASLARCKPKTLSWYIAAFGRCVRPFMTGSRYVFFLIENHLLQMYGLPWRSKLLPQRAFRWFQDHAFNNMCASNLVYA